MARKGYLLAEVKVFDSKHFQTEYASKVNAILSEFGGVVIVADDDPKVVEGGRDVSRVVIIEFESTDRLKEFYESDVYQTIAPERLRSAHSHLYMLAGVQVLA
ncbi:DUF1330 domain-containing protein [Paraburkholderia solisilvae]|uniref:DUF1330 domain-containing protein n=1 Tax=Paraburkholderia solisilvae TaxID=624376 RepID=A0A6J5ETX1_9BURK|nr:DUF1330 domain-containing protein [Paraburkholderia solisilvae]CAB3769990.1 hypothetical protein LMG29739_05673 [Paraburkholderia solisilvae]